jgi:hypothetical protein
MTLSSPTIVPPTPSRRRLAATTAVSLAVAGLLLTALVLPAEYAIDPLGTGRWLGLTEIAAPRVAAAETTRVEGAPLAPAANGPMADYPRPFKVDVFEVELGPFESLEYKYQLEQGATMSYSWTASAPIVQDFHGEAESGGPDGGPRVQSYDTRDRATADGSFVAPFSGIHGWFWENASWDPVTIRLSTSGFYSAAVEMRPDAPRVVRPLRDLASLKTAPTAAQ